MRADIEYSVVSLQAPSISHNNPITTKYEGDITMID